MKKTIYYASILLSLGVLAGCGQTKGASVHQLTKEEQALVWQEEREKTFGYYDYKALPDEQEMTTLMETKFGLSLPKSYAIFQQLLADTPYFQQQQVLGHAYELIASGEQLLVHTQTQFGGEQTQVTADVSLTYKVNPTDQRAYLAEQTLVIHDETPAETIQLYDSLPELCKGVAQPLTFGDVNDEVTAFQKEHGAVEPELAQQALSVTDNTAAMKEKKGLQKSIQVFYDANGVLREVYVSLMDLTE